MDEFKHRGAILDSPLTLFKKDMYNKYNVANIRHIRNSSSTEAAYMNAMVPPIYIILVCKQDPVGSLPSQALKVLHREPRQHNHCTILEMYKNSKH